MKHERDMSPASVVDLTPCPFCGEAGVSLAVEIEDGGAEKRAAVECSGCLSRGPAVGRSQLSSGTWDEAEQEAVVQWNQRTELGKDRSK